MGCLLLWLFLESNDPHRNLIGKFSACSTALLDVSGRTVKAPLTLTSSNTHARVAESFERQDHRVIVFLLF